MLKEMIIRLVDGQDLSEREMGDAMEMMMAGTAPEAQVGAFLTAFRLKGETEDEIVAAARVIRRHAAPMCFARPTGTGACSSTRIVDTCGTGGDSAHTFNISTAAAFVLAGAGLRVAKHGNRAVSSHCGSADVLQALGVDIDADVATVHRCIDEVGIGFLYAPRVHTAMRHVARVRQALGIRTIFNLVGPLTNPVGVDCQVVGVYRRELTTLFARALARLGTKRALVVHGSDGLDEVTISGATHVAELRDGTVREHDVYPEDAGLRRASAEAVRGGDAVRNAEIIRGVLAGDRGPQRDVVVLNAAVALAVAGEARDLRHGAGLAATSIDSGRARAKLDGVVELTRGPLAAAPAS